MRISTLLISSSSALVAAELLREPPGEAEFQSILQHNEQVLVSFTSRSLDSVAPFNDVFRKTVKNASIPFVTLDCDQAPSSCASHDINSYPTIRYFEHAEDGEIISTRYRGPRTTKGLLSFVTKREIPVLTRLERSDMDFRRIDDIVFIAMLDPSDTHHLNIFTSVAEEHHLDYVFGYTTDLTIAEKEKVQAPSVICYQNNDGTNIILGGAFTYADAEKFVFSGRVSVIREFKEKDVEDYMQRDKLIVYIFVSSPEASRKMRHRLVEVAMKLRQVVTFATVDMGRYPDMPMRFGTEMSGEVSVVVHAPMNDDLFFYKRGKKVEKGAVEDMLMLILRGKASQGQVFGEEAEDEKGEKQEGEGVDVVIESGEAEPRKEHDEL